MIKSCEGLLLEGDVEGQVEEGDSGKVDVEVKEDELWNCLVGKLFLRIRASTITIIDSVTPHIKDYVLIPQKNAPFTT